MPKNIHITPSPVTLEGYQAILKPSKFGYSLKAVVGQEIVEALETERADCLKWAESKLKNPKRSTLRPEPWEEVSEGKFIVKFSWAEDKRPPVVDTEGTPITNFIDRRTQNIILLNRYVQGETRSATRTVANGRKALGHGSSKTGSVRGRQHRHVRAIRALSL